MAAPLQVWVTRAQPGADATAARLIRAGLRPLVAPVLEVRPLDRVQPDLTAVDVLAFTSANGVRAWAEIEPRRNLSAYCVGEATAATAREAGFTQVVSADGDVAVLAELLSARLPAGTTVLHPCAAETAGDLSAPLEAAGLSLRQLPIYETRAVDALPAAVAQALAEQAMGAILIHSPKAARAVANLLPAVAPQAIAGVRVLAISPAALAPLHALPFTAALAAPTPSEAALLALLT